MRLHCRQNYVGPASSVMPDRSYCESWSDETGLHMRPRDPGVSASPDGGLPSLRRSGPAAPEAVPA